MAENSRCLGRDDGVEKMFKCDKCGLCCRKVFLINSLKHLDDGTGKCKYLDDSTNLCTIYGSRPILCNVDKCYETYFSKMYSIEEYYELNYEACKNLKNKGVE